MPDYTESQIRELTGRELRVAVSLLVLGDDLTANTDERLKQAVNSYCYGDVNVPLDPVQFEHVQHTYGKGRVSWDWARWLCRFGMPYQSDLEQHVANWRAEPLPMPLDWCEGLFAKGMPLYPTPRLRPQVYPEDNQWHVDDFVTDEDIASGPDMKTAILRAACIVKLREGE